MLKSANLYDLILDNHKDTNLRSLNTELLEIKWYKRNPLLFAFLAKSYESYSNPQGHLVVIKFSKDGQQMLMKDCKVVCTCPAYLYWGSKYNATVGEYAYKSTTSIAPDKRDPNRERKICKHIAAVRQYFKNQTGKTIHKKFKKQFEEIPSVRTKIKSSAEKTIPFNDIEVLTALNEVIEINPIEIQDDKVFEDYVNQVLCM